MRRAALLVVFMLLVTAGVGCYLPRGVDKTTIFYQQAGDREQPVFCEQGDRKLILEQITLSNGTLWEKPATFVTLLLHAPPTAVAAVAPALSVSLLDDLGQEYGRPLQLGSTACALTNGSSWRYELRFMGLNRRASSITVLAQTEDSLFRLAKLPLPLP